MNKRTQHLRILAALAPSCALAAAISAEAEDYCVVCLSPSAMYRCEIKGTPEGRGTNSKSQLHCITELAKSGKHESCLVSKSAPVPCPGLTVVLSAPGETGATVGEAHPPMRGTGTGASVVDTTVPASAGESHDAPPLEEPPAKEASGSPAIAGAPKNDPAAPKTVEELAGKTVAATKDSISKAGSAVTGTAEKAGNAAKSTWKCITSLFSDC